MRLLTLDGAGGVLLTRDFSDDEVPPYAILSHTWGTDDEEVTYDDLQSSPSSSKPGMAKILFCGEQSRTDGTEHFWVDSCCIDKRNSTELSEAIISMFRWYKNSRKCYVYLSDVSTLKRDHSGQFQLWETAFRSSRWFTRGWTLQELLAPNIVEFYSRDRTLLGDKNGLEALIQSITGLPLKAIRGGRLSEFTPNERLSWAAKRSTKRKEDKYYCLLGLFDVFLAPQYGEGHHAATRLQEAISKRWSQLDLRLLDSAPSASTSVGHISDVARLERRQALLESLSFEQMDVRRSTIKSAQSSTCEWLLKHSIFLEWHAVEDRPEGRHILWLSGKPGAGKSTLVKFALTHAQKKQKSGDLITHFFFNARGDQMEKSTIGMYRALLRQLFQQAPDLQESLENLPPGVGWTISRLQGLFSAAIQRLGRRRLTCFVDALDECDEEEIRDMVQYFEDLNQGLAGQNNPLSVLFASRHYPTIEIRDGWRLKLEDESGHGEDLVKYIKRHLRAIEGKGGDSLREAVHRKANGVFIWVVLVVDILNKESDRGRKFAMKRRLDEIPPELSELFKQILCRDQVNMDDLLLCLQWILFAEHPLKREEFYFAMTAGLVSSENMTQDSDVWDATNVSQDEMTRFIHNSSKGLAELTKSKTAPTVQFIHESVRDFLIKDGGIYELWPDLASDFASLSHDKLKTCCYTYLQHGLFRFLAFIPCETHPNNRWFNARSNAPFLDYATNHLFYHCDQAAAGLPQDRFLADLNLSLFVDINNKLEKHKRREHPADITLAYVLAEKNCGKLIETLGFADLGGLTRRGRFRYPLLAAFVSGSMNAIRSLLRSRDTAAVEEISQDPGFGKISDISQHENPVAWSTRGRNWSLARILVHIQPLAAKHLIDPVGDPMEAIDAWPRDLLELALLHGGFESSQRSKLALERRVESIGKSDVAQSLVNRLCENSEKPCWKPESFSNHLLEFACSTGNYQLVSILIDLRRRSRPDGARGTPNECLCKDVSIRDAILAGSEPMVRLLLDNGASTSEHLRNDILASSFLVLAAESGRQDMIELLLLRGADINASARYTVLGQACCIGNVALVDFLIDRGARVDLMGSYGSAPLHLACENAHLPVVKVLLSHGADIGQCDDRGNTALHIAAFPGQAPLMKFLLDHGRPACSTNFENKIPTDSVLNLAASMPFGVPRPECKISDLFDRKERTTIFETLGVANKQGYTPLTLACTSKSPRQRAVVKLLLEYGACMDKQTPEGYTVLSLAIRLCNIPLVELLLSHGAPVDSMDKGRYTPLLVACRMGQARSAELLLQHGARIDHLDSNGSTAFELALSSRSTSTMQTLLEHGATVNVATEVNGDRAIHLAAKHGSVALMRLLLDSGADVESKNSRGETALLITCRRRTGNQGGASIAALLLENGADVDAVDQDGDGSLWWAITESYLFGYPNVETMEWIIDLLTRFGNSALLIIPKHWSTLDPTFDLLQLLRNHMIRRKTATELEVMAVEEARVREDPVFRNIPSPLEGAPEVGVREQRAHTKGLVPTCS